MKKTLFLLIAIALAIALSMPPALAQEIGDYPTNIGSVNAEVSISGNGSVSGGIPQGSKVIVKLLTFSESGHQTINGIEEFIEINGNRVYPTYEKDKYGNRFAVFELYETGDFSYKIRANIETQAGISGLKDYDLNTPVTRYAEFLLPSQHVESNDSTVRTIALNDFNSDSWIETVRGVADWTHNYVTYDWAYYPDTYSTLQVLESRRGVCDEFATLAAGMLRVKGIPTRFAVGVSYSGGKWANHAWNEVFSPSAGWVQLDSTYGEVGLVDGTHITMGVFSDPAEAADRISFPETAKVLLGEKSIDVKLNGTTRFENVLSVDVPDLEMNTGEWAVLQARISNGLSTYNIVPLELVLPNGFETENKSRTISFKPNEIKVVEWELRTDTPLKENQYLEGQFKIFSTGSEITRNLKVFPGLAGDGGKLKVTQVVPLVRDGVLFLNVSVANSGTSEATVSIDVPGLADSPKTGIVPALSEKTFSLGLGVPQAKTFSVLAKGSGLDYSKEITLQDSVALPPKKAPQTPSEGTAQIKGPKDNPVSVSSLSDLKGIVSDETLIIAGVAAVLIALGIVLKGLIAKK